MLEAIVTGGATGIGKACVESLIERDTKVHLIYHTSEKEAIAYENRSDVQLHKVDVTSEIQVIDFFNQIGSFDILINNAGGNISFATTESYSTDDWKLTFDLNTLSVFLMCKYGIPLIRDGGKIINITSISAKSGGAPGGMAYAASKAAVDCMTKSLARELASRNICVNAISPGIVWTKQHEKFSSKEYYDSLIEKIPLGRDGSTRDISNLAKFLSSSESSYITGQTIEINGGMLMK
ncbi:oxidoreductase [archaeon]|nr:oxidoreductase [archaeon]